MGVKVVIQDMAFDSIIASIQTGKIEIGVAGISDAPTREKIVDFTIPFYQSLDSVLVTGGSKVSITSPQDIVTYEVGFQTGTGYDSLVTFTATQISEIESRIYPNELVGNLPQKSILMNTKTDLLLSSRQSI